MVSLRKLLLIPTALVALAGIASAANTGTQAITCTPAATVVASLRSEGRTEALTAIKLSCTAATPDLTVGSTATAGFNIVLSSAQLLFTSPAAPSIHAPTITIKPAAGAAITSAATATITPTQILFTGVALPVTANAAFDVTFSNILVDASALAVTAIPTVDITFTPTTPAVSGALVFGGTTNKANTGTIATFGKSLYVFDSLTVGGVQKPTDFAACANETIDTTMVGGGTNGHLIDSLSFTPLTGSPFALGDRIQATFANLPSGVQLYAPLTIAVGTSTTASLVTGFNATTLVGGFVATDSAAAADKLYPVGPSGVIVYQITSATSATTGSDTLTFDVFAIAKGPVLAATPVTITAGYAPTGGVFPRFVAGTLVSRDFFTVAGCQSSLFFPYVVAGSGYSTGIAISSSGDFGDASKAASGQCTVTYMGKGAPTTAKTVDVLAGQTSAFVVASDVPAASFYGYAVAKCNFLNASGYAYIGNSTGGSASYLPLYQAK